MGSRPHLIAEEYEREKRNAQRESVIRKRLKEYIAIAAYNNVFFEVEEETKGWWTISVRDEKGVLTDVPTSKVATLVHGLFLMGKALREKRMSPDWYW